VLAIIIDISSRYRLYTMVEVIEKLANRFEMIVLGSRLNLFQFTKSQRWNSWVFKFIEDHRTKVYDFYLNIIWFKFYF